MSKNTNSIKTIKNSDMHVPLLVHTTFPSLPNSETVKSAMQVARDTRLSEHIAVMSDANKKKKVLNPASSTAVSENFILPQLFDAAPNCGMRLIATDLTDEEVTSTRSDLLFKRLIESIPTRKYFAKPIPLRVLIRTFIEGSAPLARHLKVRTINEVERTYENGNMFSAIPAEMRLRNFWDLIKAVPPVIVIFARYRLGILGATDSHYLTLMKIDKILDEKSAKKLGVRQNQYVFYLHTGSGIVGRYIGQLYSSQPHLKSSHRVQLFILKLGFLSSGYRRVKKLIKKSLKEGSSLGFTTGTKETKLCAQALQAAGNQGFANRTLITHRLDMCLEKTFHRQVKMNLIYDAPHVLVSNETHSNKQLWVHRNGTTRSLGPASNVLKLKIGEPGLLAAFENTWSYLGTGTDENTTSFTSANHELGKLKNTPNRALSHVAPKPRHSKFNEVKFYTQKKTWIVAPKETHAAFGEAIAEEIESNGLLDLVARMKTIKVLTHYKP